jgi:hypothetical protein
VGGVKETISDQVYKEEGGVTCDVNKVTDNQKTLQKKCTCRHVT